MGREALRSYTTVVLAVISAAVVGNAIVRARDTATLAGTFLAWPVDIARALAR